MTDTAAPSPALRAIRWRTHLDHVLVFAIIIALWSLATWRFGTYWVSSPWAVAIRFVEMVASGELIRHAGYTLAEAAAGTLIGGVPAVLLPLLLRRHPVMVAILDPFMVGGYGAPKLAFAPLFIVWFGIGMEFEDRAGGQRRVLHRLFRDAQRRARARRQAGADRADLRRQRTTGRTPYRPAGRDPVDLRRLPHRRALRHRRGRHRRTDLRQPRARLPGAERRDEFRHHQRVRRRADGDAAGAGRDLADERIEARLLRWRPPIDEIMETGT